MTETFYRRLYKASDEKNHRKGGREEGQGRPQMSIIGQDIKDVKEQEYVTMKRLADGRTDYRTSSNQSSDY